MKQKISNPNGTKRSSITAGCRRCYGGCKQKGKVEQCVPPALTGWNSRRDACPTCSTRQSKRRSPAPPAAGVTGVGRDAGLLAELVVIQLAFRKGVHIRLPDAKGQDCPARNSAVAVSDCHLNRFVGPVGPHLFEFRGGRLCLPWARARSAENAHCNRLVGFQVSNVRRVLQRFEQSLFQVLDFPLFVF